MQLLWDYKALLGLNFDILAETWRNVNFNFLLQRFDPCMIPNNMSYPASTSLHVSDNDMHVV